MILHRPRAPGRSLGGFLFLTVALLVFAAGAAALLGPWGVARWQDLPPLGRDSTDPAAILAATVERAAAMPRLRTLIVARDGVPIVERAFRDQGLDEPGNIKSVSKSVISALVGIAIDKGLLQGVDQPVAPILGDRVPPDADPRVGEITIGHLLSMRAGLERTSGANYGPWIMSANWVQSALARPFVDEPGGRRLYSTGNTHLLSAVLTAVSGHSTLELAREWLGEPLGIEIPEWERDPQGIYLGGNDMALPPRALLRFGEAYRNGGVFEGRRVLPEGWVRASWTPRGASRSGDQGYGYGWFATRVGRHAVHYGWGYGGQMLYVVPNLGLTIVMTSDPKLPSGGYVRELHALVAEGFIPAAEAMPAFREAASASRL
ncbi:MAG TPA: serine hydrolase [Afifellaceae bacterium]|nr:serine hydrolase [Afifellaceae bacterium]